MHSPQILGRLVRALLSIVILASAAPLLAQVRLLPDRFESVDLLAIERDDRELFAFDALTGRRSSFRLDVAEEILFQASQGRIGIVLTDRRLLGVASGTDWVESPLAIQEVPPDVALVDDRVGLLTTNRRAAAFTSSGQWVEARFSPNEKPSALRVGAAVGVVTTNRRALGIGPGRGSFVEFDLRVKEPLESVSATDALATVRSAKRILVFSSIRGAWSVQRRERD